MKLWKLLSSSIQYMKKKNWQLGLVIDRCAACWFCQSWPASFGVCCYTHAGLWDNGLSVRSYLCWLAREKRFTRVGTLKQWSQGCSATPATPPPKHTSSMGTRMSLRISAALLVSPTCLQWSCNRDGSDLCRRTDWGYWGWKVLTVPNISGSRDGWSLKRAGCHFSEEDFQPPPPTYPCPLPPLASWVSSQGVTSCLWNTCSCTR